jgi:glycosyltransferase involved in cell wall biosynthesis
MRITFYHRRPLPCHYFSVERAFADIRKVLPLEIHATTAVSKYLSRGIWRRVYNIIEAVCHQGDINHITGDVHFLTFLLRKKKTLLTILDCVSLEQLSGWRKWILFLFWYWLPEKRSSLISVISASTKQELLRYLKCDPDKIRVVYCPVSDEFQPTPLEFRTEQPIILQVGTARNKNLLRIAEALQGIPCHLRIIGKLSENQVESLSQNQITYSTVAGISNQELVREYQKCDMVIFASTYEGFGLPIVEAQATGRPAVTSNILSMPEVAGDAACLVDPFDVTGIKNGILHVIQDKEYREKLIILGYKNIERFRPKAIAEQYVKLYEEIIRGYSKC